MRRDGRAAAKGRIAHQTERPATDSGAPATASVNSRGSARDGPRHDIGRRLRERREAQGFSLRALADRIGVTASLLSQIETGQVNPSVDTLFALADGLQMSVAEFFSASVPATDRASQIAVVPPAPIH